MKTTNWTERLQSILDNVSGKLDDGEDLLACEVKFIKGMFNTIIQFIKDLER